MSHFVTPCRSPRSSRKVTLRELAQSRTKGLYYHAFRAGAVTGNVRIQRHSRNVEFNNQPMPASVIFSQPLTLEQIISQIFALGRISAMDRALLHLAVQTSQAMSDREQTLVEQLQSALNQGKLEIA